jgi:hypothetical protein
VGKRAKTYAQLASDTAASSQSYQGTGRARKNVNASPMP